MKIKFNTIYLKNFRRGLATNSSSTHSLIYRNDNEVFEDLGVFDNDYYGRHTKTIAATREAKIKYVLANIMYNDALVEVMSKFYPEMEQYFPDIKATLINEEKSPYATCDDNGFGCCYRGSMTSDDLKFNIDYLRNIIDNPDIVIVGGSDETDFVYDTIEGHDKEPLPDDHYCSAYSHISTTPIKNGNYYTCYGEKNSSRYSGHYRLRFSTTPNAPVPEYPELIDIRITNRCENGCPFCFMDSNLNEPDADFNFLKQIANQLKIRTEFSIGGGNVLLYPHFEEFVKLLHENGHVVNVTINAKNAKDIISDEHMIEVFRKYVDGCGVSVFNDTDIDELDRLKRIINKEDGKTWNPKRVYFVAHLIPELLGVGGTINVINRIRKKNQWVDYLFLGYKTNGRGKNLNYRHFTDHELDQIFKEFSHSVAIDTTFANRYEKYIKKHFSHKYSITMNEGEFSMYIDGITKSAYKSSYQTDKPYLMWVDYSKYQNYRDMPDTYNVKEAFTKIREDGGFEVYDKIKRSVYDNVEPRGTEEED